MIKTASRCVLSLIRGETYAVKSRLHYFVLSMLLVAILIEIGYRSNFDFF